MADDWRLLAVLAKFWTPGQVKTRLAAAIGAAAAADMHRQFVATTLNRMAGQGDRHWLAAAPPEAVPQFAKWTSTLPGNWSVVPQDGRDLGQRMKRLIEAGFDAGANRIVLIGSDSPDLPTAIAEQAFERLKDCPVVIGPSADGGYYLVGASQCVPPIFDDMPWSTSSVAEHTINRLQEAGINFALLPPWRDVDDHADLAALDERLARTAQAEASLVELRQAIAPWTRSPIVSAAGT
jgi:rSAM/selenodomain-associated transferase 1